MGFLDNIIKKGIDNGITDGISKGISNGISSVLEGKVGEKLTEAINPLSDAVNKFAEDVSAYSNDNTYSNAASGGAVVRTTGESLSGGQIEDNFFRVLTTEFSDYEIRRNISAMEIGGSNIARNYTFGLYQGGIPKMLITLTPHNRYQNRPFREAKSACENQGIVFMNFFTHFSNEKTYVVNRIQNALS